MNETLKLIIAKKDATPEEAKAHGALSFSNKKQAFYLRSAYIKAKGDKMKRRKARTESEKWVNYLIAQGKLEEADRSAFISWLCPML